MDINYFCKEHKTIIFIFVDHLVITLMIDIHKIKSL